ncbi:hypothetical protein ACRAQ6_07530 [Erythrobacter sp. HA6-11]
MLKSGEIVSASFYDGEEHSPAQNLIDLAKDAFKADADLGKLNATAIVYDVRAVPPGEVEKSDAIAVNLDHRSNYSVVVLFPYELSNDEPVIGEPFAIAGDFAIFSQRLH